jgi:hypothetical protein
LECSPLPASSSKPAGVAYLPSDTRLFADSDEL